jgi:hypothetical protein
MILIKESKNLTVLTPMPLRYAYKEKGSIFSFEPISGRKNFCLLLIFPTGEVHSVL